jgi:glutamate N-acetyltransferase/amino-acid N-acetyltransferase
METTTRVMERIPTSQNRVSDARPVLPAGFRAAALHCGIRAKKTKFDLGLIVADRAYPAAALFTSNQLVGAHVVVGRESLAKSRGKVRALLVNSGNANCSTGEEGIEDNRGIQRALAELIGCPPEQVLFMSTGVIGARLPRERILEALPSLVAGATERGLGDFGTAIMTTDLVPKIRTLAVEDKAGPPYRVTGEAKGSGMNHPNIDTMLAYVFTDGPADDHPKEMLRRIADRSFHRLTVDGDTSPNDTFLLWSSLHA